MLALLVDLMLALLVDLMEDGLKDFSFKFRLPVFSMEGPNEGTTEILGWDEG